MRERSTRAGSVTVMAVVMLFVVSVLLAATTRFLVHTDNLRTRAAQRSELRAGLDAGVALAQAELAAGESTEFALTHSAGDVAVEVVATPRDAGACRVEVKARTKRGGTGTATVEFTRTAGGPGEGWGIADCSERLAER